MFKNTKGFTLIEFIIVMAIIGILVLMAAPKFMDYVNKAKITQIKNDERVVQDVLLASEANSITNDSKPYSMLANEEKEGYGIKIKPEFIKQNTNTKLNKDNFYFDEENMIVNYYNNTIKDNNDTTINKEDKDENLDYSVEKHLNILRKTKDEILEVSQKEIEEALSKRKEIMNLKTNEENFNKDALSVNYHSRVDESGWGLNLNNNKFKKEEIEELITSYTTIAEDYSEAECDQMVMSLLLTLNGVDMNYEHYLFNKETNTKIEDIIEKNQLNNIKETIIKDNKDVFKDIDKDKIFLLITNYGDIYAVCENDKVDLGFKAVSYNSENDKVDHKDAIAKIKKQWLSGLGIVTF